MVRVIKKEVVANSVLFVLGVFVVGFILDQADSSMVGQSITGQSINDEPLVVSVSEGGSKNAGLFESVSSFAVKSAKYAANSVQWVYVGAAAVALLIVIFAAHLAAISRKRVNFDVELKRMNDDMKKVELVIKRR